MRIDIANVCHVSLNIWKEKLAKRIAQEGACNINQYHSGGQTCQGNDNIHRDVQAEGELSCEVHHPARNTKDSCNV